MVAHVQLNQRRGSVTLYRIYVRRLCSMITYDHVRPVFKRPVGSVFLQLTCSPYLGVGLTDFMENPK